MAAKFLEAIFNFKLKTSQLYLHLKLSKFPNLWAFINFSIRYWLIRLNFRDYWTVSVRKKQQRNFSELYDVAYFKAQGKHSE